MSSDSNQSPNEFSNLVNEIFSDALNFIEEKFLLFKHPSFIDEREFRIAVIQKSTPDTTKDRFHVSRGKLTTYLEEAIPDRENALRRVMIGPKNASDKDTVARFLKTHGFGDVEVLRSEAPLR